MKGPYLVEWEDSCSPSGGMWIGRKDVTEPVVCRSVGFIVKKNKRGLVLCADITPDQIGRVITIPKSALRKCKALK